MIGGGLAAAVWGLSPPVQADQPASADGFLALEAAPARLQLAPPPAEPASAYAYSGATPGPLLRLKQGGEMKLRFANRLAEPTTLSFPGLRAANPAAGIGGLTQERIKPGASADIRFVAPDSGFNLYFPHAGSTDAGQQGRGLFGPIIVDEATKPDVDLDAAVVLSDWSVDDNGQIKDDFADPAIGRGSGRKGGLVFANSAPAPLKLSARPGARVRLRLGNAATARIAAIAIEGAKTVIVAVDGQPSEPFEPLNNQFPMGPGARFELMFDLPREGGGGVRLALRGGDGEADRPFIVIAAEGEPGQRARRPAPPLAPIRVCRPRSRSKPRSAAISPSQAAARRPSPSTARVSSTGRRSPPTPFRAARPPCSRSPTRRLWCRRSAFGAMSRASCTRWTMAGSPIGATPFSSSRAAQPTSPSSPTIPANGRSNRRSPNIAPPVSRRGSKWGEAGSRVRREVG